MNLMSMVNGLNRMDDTNPFSATAFLLAVKLIDLFNRLMWADSVAVDLPRMSAMARCSSKAAVMRARDELIERGVLDIVRKGKKGNPTTYRLNDLSAFGSKNEPNREPNPIPNREPNPIPNREPNREPISIQDNNIYILKGLEEEDEEDAFDRACAKVRQMAPWAYFQAFGSDATPAEVDRMVILFANLNLEEVCEDALRETAMASPRNRMAYLTKVCSDWHAAWIRTKEDLQEHQQFSQFSNNGIGDPAESMRMMMQALEKRKEKYTA